MQTSQLSTWMLKTSCKVSFSLSEQLQEALNGLYLTILPTGFNPHSYSIGVYSCSVLLEIFSGGYSGWIILYSQPAALTNGVQVGTGWVE